MKEYQVNMYILGNDSKMLNRLQIFSNYNSMQLWNFDLLWINALSKLDQLIVAACIEKFSFTSEVLN